MTADEAYAKHVQLYYLDGSSKKVSQLIRLLKGDVPSIRPSVHQGGMGVWSHQWLNDIFILSLYSLIISLRMYM